MEKGILFVVSGFSGAGKGTILKKVFEKMPDLKFSVSATSRKSREGEIDGVHYHFKTPEEFEKLISENAFVEYTKTFTNYYGTLKSEIEEPLQKGINVVFDINVVGAKAIKEMYPECVSVFVTPPSLGVLRDRLIGRGSETEETLARRINEAKKEILEMKEYDFVLVNDQIDECADELSSIIRASKCQTKRNIEFIDRLSKEQNYDD